MNTLHVLLKNLGKDKIKIKRLNAFEQLLPKKKNDGL